MIRSSQHILKFANKSKIEMLDQLFIDYKSDLEFYIKLILDNKLPLKNNLSSSLLPTNIIYHSQWRQIIYKQASKIIRNNIDFQINRRYKRYKKIYSYFKVNGRQIAFTNKRFSDLKLKPIRKYIKIDINKISINVDQRLLSIQRQNDSSFDEFVGMRLPYFQAGIRRSIQINLPIKQHRHSLKYQFWNRKNTIQLLKINNNYYLKFCYEKSDKELRTGDSKLGIDIGYKKLIADSNGEFYGGELEDIYKKIANKKQKSKNYKQALTYKKNKINEITNQFINKNKEIDILFIEGLKNVKRNSKFSKKFNNKLQYWSYKQVIDKIGLYCSEYGVNLVKVSPEYTSQTCSKCGIVEKTNRKGEVYQCGCGNLMDADHNAAINILHRGTYSSSNNKTETSEQLHIVH